MKKLFFLALLLFTFCVSVPAQSGQTTPKYKSHPDIDEVMPHYAVPDVKVLLFVMPECYITYTLKKDDGDGLGSVIGPVTPPPNCGYQGVTSDPTMSGCEFVTFSGKDKDGKDFSVTAQVYIYKGTTTDDKAKKISDELNDQSDNIPNDPVVSSSANGNFTVQPAAGGKITSAEWDNGSGEEDNELNELFYEKKHTSASKIKGITTGLNDTGEPSSIMIGFGQFKIQTFVKPNENHTDIIARLKYGLTFLGIKAKSGFDSEGVCWLVWDNPYRKTRFGSNDTGISHMIVSDRLAPSLTDQLQNVKVGRYLISF